MGDGYQPGALDDALDVVLRCFIVLFVFFLLIKLMTDLLSSFRKKMPYTHTALKKGISNGWNSLHLYIKFFIHVLLARSCLIIN
jgi:hypothetical protein